ncbi:chain-length determining protein [Congregibacter sp.]|uniref:chain-length determining protein n=1 Tax=Congregibacter sp. TaxID=2744308 RepID=UPI00385A0DC4
MTQANDVVAPQHTAAANLDLMPFVNALIRAKWLLLAGLIIGASYGVYHSLTTPYSYVAGAKVSIVDIEDPGGVSPDDRRASEVLTLVEHGFVMGTTRDNYSEVMMARLRSRTFTLHFLNKHNIYRHFYPAQWSEETQSWKDGFTPDIGESFTRFRDEIRMITVDEETDIITVAMRWPEPVLPRDWSNLYVQTFNEYMRDRTKEEVNRKQAFLERTLRESDVVEIQKSIYRLIEAQTAIMMLANAREEYVLEIIDPAARPYRSVNMSRKKKVLVGGVVGLMLSTFAVLGIALLLQLWNSFQTARNLHLQNNSTNTDIS